MKQLYYLLLCLCFAYGALAQNKSVKSNTIAVKEPDNSVQVAPFPDKLKIELPPEYFKEPDKDWLKDYLPAFITLLVGIGTIAANWYVSKKLRETNLNIISDQLKEARELKLIELQVNITIKNKHEWIDKFNLLIAQYLTYNTIIFVRLNDKNTSVFEFSQLTTQLQLILNPNKASHDSALKEIKQIAELFVIGAEKRFEMDEKLLLQLSTSRNNLIFYARQIGLEALEELNDIINKANTTNHSKQ